MTPRSHFQLTKAFLIINAVPLLIWGAINLFMPDVLAGKLDPNLMVFDLSSRVARSEVRAMYGGLQVGLGAFVGIGAVRPSYRDPALLLSLCVLTGLTAARWTSMVIEGESHYLHFAAALPPGGWNQAALSMYELPMTILAWVVLLLRPRSAGTDAHAGSSEKSRQTSLT